MSDEQQQLPPLRVSLNVPSEGLTIDCELEAQVAYGLLRSQIVKFSYPAEDKNPAARQLASMLKVAIKGVLMMYGSKILDVFIGSDHPRPGKKDDLVDWYTDVFARIGVLKATKHVLLLQGVRRGDTIQIFATGSRPSTEDFADAPGSGNSPRPAAVSGTCGASSPSE